MGNISISLKDYNPSFYGGGYVMSYVTQTVLHSRILCMKRDDGTVGYGELVSDPALDLKMIFSLEDALLKQFDNLEFKDVLSFATKINAMDNRYSAMSFALETAYFDLLTKSADIPMYSMFGGKLASSIPDYLSISCGLPEKMAKDLEIKGKNRKVIQIKLDGKDIDVDLARIDSILGLLLDKQTLLIDFNGALNIKTAQIFISHYSDSRIIWEEPCFYYEENRELANQTGNKILFDQCLKSLKIITQACSEGVMAGACIKPMCLGSLSLAQSARDICISSSIPVRIDGLWCGPIANTTIAHLAISTPPSLLISGCDLCEPLLLSDDWGNVIKENGNIEVGNSAGHGIIPPKSFEF